MKLEEATITAYLLGELEPAETEAVRAAIAADPHWQAVVRDYETLLTGFREQKVNQYAAEVADVPPTPPATSRPWLWLLPVLIALVAAWLFWPARSSPASLAQEYFILPKDPTVAGDTEANAVYQDGLTAFFRARDYAAAAAAFSRIRTDADWGTRANFYLGHAWFLTEEYGQAQTALEQSLRQADVFSRFEQNDLRWNILMARLARGEDIRAELRALPERTEQQDLLRELDE